MNTTKFDYDDIRKHVEAVQNDIAKREKKIELLDPLLTGTCVRCGQPLIDINQPLKMCSQCLRDTGHDVYEMSKRKRKAQEKNKKMPARHVLHINQIKTIG